MAEKPVHEHVYQVGIELRPDHINTYRKMVVITCAECNYEWIAGRARSNGRLARWFRRHIKE